MGGGSGYVLSRPVAEWINYHRDSLHEYHNEDAALGIWINESQLNVRWNHKPERFGTMWNLGVCLERKRFIYGQLANTCKCPAVGALYKCHKDVQQLDAN